jgi:hypothetical protein
MLRQQSQAAGAAPVTLPVSRRRATLLVVAPPVDAAPPPAASSEQPPFLHGVAYDGLRNSATTLSDGLRDSATTLSGGLQSGFRDGGSALGDRVAVGLIVVGVLLGASNLAAAFVRRRRDD